MVERFIPTVGESFTFMNYGSLFGKFSTIKDLNFDNMHWSVTYPPTYAVLAAEAGRAVPESGFTASAFDIGPARSGDVSATVAPWTSLVFCALNTGDGSGTDDDGVRHFLPSRARVFLPQELLNRSCSNSEEFVRYSYSSSSGRKSV
jgi:hypothetical protein